MFLGFLFSLVDASCTDELKATLKFYLFPRILKP